MKTASDIAPDQLVERDADMSRGTLSFFKKRRATRAF
jgi:hypothetical protein